MDSRNQTRFKNWFNKLGQAWIDRDPIAVPPLFADKFEYYETPFGKPYTSHSAIEKLWEEVPETQDQVKFESQVLSVEDNVGIAHWAASFYRTDKKTTAFLDGIFLVQLDKNDQAQLFRWWSVEKKQ